MLSFKQLIPPRIGGATSTAGIAPGAPPAQRDPANLLGGISALTGVLGVLRENEEQENEQASRLIMVQKKGEYRRAVDDALASHDPAAPDYMTRVGETLAKAREGTMQDTGISSDRVLDDLELDLADLEQGGLIVAATGRRAALKDKALLLRDDHKQRALEMIRDDPDAFPLHVEDFGTTMESLAPSIPPAELEALAAEFADEALEAQVEGLIGPNQMRFAEARELIDAHGGEISAQHKRALTGLVISAENAASNRLEMDTSRTIADFDIAVSDATEIATLDRIRADIEGGDRLGLFDGRQEKRAGLISKLNTKRASLIEAQKDLSAAVISAATGPLTQKEGDLLWPEVKKRIDDPAKFKDVLAQFAHDHGVVPTEIRERMVAVERAEDPALLAEAADMHAELAAAAPNTGFEPGLRVQAVNSLARLAGMTREDAAKRVISQMPDPPTAKQRGEAYNDDHEVEGAELLEDLGIAPDVSYWWGLGYDLEGAPVAEAEELRKQAFVLTGDIDAANEMTKTAMSQRWGLTRAGGTRLQKYPPENYFPAETIPSKDPKHHRKGLPDEARALIMDELVNGRLDAAGWPARSGYTLVPTEQAQRRLQEGGKPEYYVFVPGPFGDTDMVRVREQLDDGTTEDLIVRVPADLTDLEGSATWREHMAQQRKAHEAYDARRARAVPPGHPFTR